MTLLKVAFSTEKPGGLDSAISEHFSRAPTVTIIDIDAGGYALSSVEENPVAEFERGSGPILAKILQDKKVDAVTASDIGKGAQKVLEELGITIISVEKGQSVRESLSMIHKQVLTEFTPHVID